MHLNTEMVFDTVGSVGSSTHVQLFVAAPLRGASTECWGMGFFCP